MTFEPLPYADGATALTGLLARPAGASRAAVLVFPTIMNPTPAVEAKARALAESGYLALIADFYGKQPATFDEARASPPQSAPTRSPIAAASRPDSARSPRCPKPTACRSPRSASAWAARPRSSSPATARRCSR
jgi:dienelactone hydrolase